MKEFGLNFGCFDIAVTPSGEFVFFECNPNGQWLWIEEFTGAPIGKAIAELLRTASQSAVKTERELARVPRAPTSQNPYAFSVERVYFRGPTGKLYPETKTCD